MTKRKRAKSKSKNETIMTRRRKKRSALPSIEVLIVLVFLGSFIIWAVTRCNATKELYELREKLGEPSTPESTAATASPSPATTAPAATTNAIAGTTTSPTTPPPPAPVQPAVYTRLYIVIDSLNMRNGPSLDSTIVTKLRLDEEVFYLNSVTEFKEKIFLNGIYENKPWVKVRSRQGKVGWIYGAGVNYYRKQRDFGE